MMLALDVGNSRIKGGLFEGPDLRQTFYIEYSGATQPERLRNELRSKLEGVTIRQTALASVVPKAAAALVEGIKQATGREPIVIHSGIPLPFRLCYETPQTLGMDRLAAAAGAWASYGQGSGIRRSIVVVDAGTAVTYEVVDRDGRYLGGAIGPGPQLVQRALHTGTAQLPEVPLEVPARVIARSTREALQAGVVYGFLDAVSGMLLRIKEDLPDEPLVVATGGWGAVLREHLTSIHVEEPHLVLHGIRVLATYAAGTATPA